MGLFFQRTIKVKPEKLASCDIFYLYPARKTRKVKINRKLVLLQDQQCTFAYKDRAYETFNNPNTYELNGNSLPTMFKQCKFNKPNRKGVISPYFKCKIYYYTTERKVVECSLKKFRFKDYDYGKQRADFYFKFDFCITNATEFLNNLLIKSNGKFANKNQEKYLYKIFEKDIRKWLNSKNFSLNDLVHYTKGYNDELTKLLSKKHDMLGIELKQISIVDIDLKEAIKSQIIHNKKISSDMEKKLEKKGFTVTKDGEELQTEFKMADVYSHDNLGDKYVNKEMGIINQKDDSEYKVTTLAGAKDEYGNPSDKQEVKVGKYCLYCGKLIPTDSIYCPYCQKEC